VSLASSRVGLTHRCTIERRTLTSDGGGGQTETWTTVGEDVPCRAWLESTGDRLDSRLTGGKVVEVEARRLIVPVGTDVQPADRVTVTVRGEAFMSVMPVSSVGRRTGHLEIICREVS
jgi:head-tail adaptor